VSLAGTYRDDYDAYRLAGDPTVVPRRKYFTLIYMTVSTMVLHLCLARPETTRLAHRLIQVYPVARGHAHITHAEDVLAPLDFVPGFLESSVPWALPRF